MATAISIGCPGLIRSLTGLFGIIGTLSNRRRRPDDGNRKRDISFETTLRMYQTLWPDVALKKRTWERGVSRRDENLSTSIPLWRTFVLFSCRTKVNLHNDYLYA